MQVFDRQNDRRIVFGQLRQVVFGENLARRGTWKYLDPLFRDGTVGNRVHILVTEGDMSHLVSRVFRQAGAAGEYIDNLLRTESHTSDIPASNLYTFLRDYMDNGIEPSAAILKETSSGLIVNGIALFRGDRYVAKVEPAEKMYFGMMLGNVKSGDVFLDYPDEDYVSEDSALLNFNSKRKIKVVSIGSPSKGQPPKVIIRIRLAGTLLEYNGDLKMAQLADRTRLEGEIERFVRTKCEAVLNLMKEHQSDAIGVGQYIRNAMPYTAWKKLDWPEEFARTQITVQVSVHIKNFGKIQ
jgi:spore germination protein